MNLDGVPFKTISAIDNDMLSSAFTEQEILELVNQCGSIKSLGPDGYNFHFIKSNLDILC